MNILYTKINQTDLLLADFFYEFMGCCCGFGCFSASLGSNHTMAVE